MGFRLLTIFLALYVSCAVCIKLPGPVDWNAQYTEALQARLKKVVLLELNMRCQMLYNLPPPPNDMAQIGYGKVTVEASKKKKIPKREAHVVKYKFQNPSLQNQAIMDFFCHAAILEIVINGKYELLVVDISSPNPSEGEIHQKANTCSQKILFWYEAVVGSFTVTQQLMPLVKTNMLERIGQINSIIQNLTGTAQPEVDKNLPDFPLIQQFQTIMTYTPPGGKEIPVKITIFQILKKDCNFLTEDLYFAALEFGKNASIALKITQFFHSPQFLLTNGKTEYSEEFEPNSGQQRFSLHWMDVDKAKTFPVFAPFFTNGGEEPNWVKKAREALGDGFQAANLNLKKVGLRYNETQIIVPYFVVEIVIKIGTQNTEIFLSLPLSVDEEEVASSPRILTTEKMAFDWAAF